MNQTELKQTQTQTPQGPLACLSAPNGYRFDGDTVHLQARFTVLNEAAYERPWALQLWACPVAPTSFNSLAGQVVAEVPLPPMSELADEAEHLDMRAFAHIPAGCASHHMALVLASGQSGRFSKVHDMVVYPNQQEFLQPRMRGMVGYRIEGNRVRLNVEHIENPRETSNRSGTLSLELWALPSPYSGAAFQGVPLAGTTVGSLAGQTGADFVSFELPYAPPPEGSWHFVLMLREWSANGYITRDFANFSNVVVSEAPKASKLPTPATAQAASAKPEQARATAQLAVPGKSGTASVQIPAAPAKVAAPKVTEVNRVLPAPVKSSAPVPQAISINSATEEELARLEGVSEKLARAITKKRPFSSVDDLRRVKGVTLKLIAAIRSRLKL